MDVNKINDAIIMLETQKEQFEEGSFKSRICLSDWNPCESELCCGQSIFVFSI